MATYLILNTVVLAGVIAFVVAFGRRAIKQRILLYVMLVMLLLTVIFDNALIIARIVAYYPEHILGLFVYKAPIEDFAYTVAAVLLVPVVWHKLKDKT